MPSLFSRSHQAPKKDRGPAVLVANSSAGDRRLLGLSKTWSGQQGPSSATGPPSSVGVGEFGTVPHSNHAPSIAPSELPHSPSGLLCSFLTTSVPLNAQSIISTDTSHDEVRVYGFLGGAGKNMVLGLDEVARVIRDIGAELQRRALDTPMLFSNQSLELNQTRMRMLIQTFLATVRTPTRIPTRTSVETFSQDIQFASDHELAWLLRWGISRMTRIREGTRDICHGCIDWDQYEEWRGRERADKYPTDAFTMLSNILAADISTHIINPLFSLLSKFAAHSHNSGLTPHAIASYFAPLLFDIPTSAGYQAAHTAFVRAAAATEHLLMSYIRSSGDRDGLGVTDLPFRLKEWIKGYPAMIASDADLARGKPRRAARVVKCEVATRSVRAYSRDLILNAETWANDIPTGWDAWDRVILKSRRGEAGRPKFSPNWRRKMTVKETLPLPQSRGHGEKIVYGMPTRGQDKDQEEENDAGRFASLAGKEWNAFEESGFDAPSRSSGVGSREQAPTGDIRKRLQFDLNESAKLSVAERRETMDWSDFADGGFTRTEPFLTASLTFSAPVQTSITEWPKERDELRRRLHKTQKEATPFAHDTTPRVGAAAQFEGADNAGRITIEEAFVDCWTDFMMGTGWTDRDELTFKESAWALIEYRARPLHADQYDAAGGDPRTSEMYFLFEERVPLDYQMAVADPKRKKSLHNIFGKKKKSQPQPQQWDPRAVQRTDFDRMLDRGVQKKVTLTRADQSVSSSLWNALSDTKQKTSPVLPPSPASRAAPQMKAAPAVPSAPKPLAKSATSSPASPPYQEPSKASDEQAKLGNGKPRIFKSIRRVKSGSDQRDRSRQQQREVSMDFEIASASGISSGTSSPQDTIHGAPDNDKWMDILVANGARKMDREDVVEKPTSPTPATNLSRKLSTPSPSSADDVTPTTTHFGALNINNPNGPVGLGLQPPPSIERRSSNGSATTPPYQTGSSQGSAASTHSEPDPAVLDPSYTPSQRSAANRSSDASSQTNYSNDDSVILPSDSVSVRHRTVPSPPESPTTPLAPAPVATLPNSPSYEGLLAPRPRAAGERDAITSIVDHYRDSVNPSDLAYQRDSQATDFSDGDAYGGVARESFIEQTYASERINSAYSIEDDLRQPPPIFDLTPGREPSPARYKHGEPLHFVGEEEEEEDDYMSRAHRF